MAFLFGVVSTVIFGLFMFVDQDVVHIEHILQIVTVIAMLAIISRFVHGISSKIPLVLITFESF